MLSESMSAASSLVSCIFPCQYRGECEEFLHVTYLAITFYGSLCLPLTFWLQMGWQKENKQYFSENFKT